VGAHSAGPRRITAGSAAARAGASRARALRPRSASVPSRVDRTLDREDPRDHHASMTRGDRVLAGLPHPLINHARFFFPAGECQARGVHSTRQAGINSIHQKKRLPQAGLQNHAARIADFALVRHTADATHVIGCHRIRSNGFVLMEWGRTWLPLTLKRRIRSSAKHCKGAG
jgi:hypothetical protein